MCPPFPRSRYCWTIHFDIGNRSRYLLFSVHATMKEQHSLDFRDTKTKVML